MEEKQQVIVENSQADRQNYSYFLPFREISTHPVTSDMIHELIEPKKKTNKAISSRNTKTFQDNKPLSDHFALDLSDTENKEAESSSTTTFIPPWLRNSLGLNQRNNQSHAAAGHSDQKPAKIIQRYKGPSQNEYESLKTNVEGNCCKKTAEQFETLSSCCPQEESKPESTDGIFNSGDRTLPPHWRVRPKESYTDSSCINTERKPSNKEDPKMTSMDVVTLAEMGKLKDEEKKKTTFSRQRSKTRKRSVSDQKVLNPNKNDADCLAEIKAKEVLSRHPVSEEVKPFENKLLLLAKNGQNTDNAVINSQEHRLMQDMKEQVGRMRDFDHLLEQVKEVNLREMMKNSEFLTEGTLDKKASIKEGKNGREITQINNDDGKSNADKDSTLSTDDENDIKRFSEFLSKNKNADEKRKCLEEVRNYFERKRRTRLSKRRYLEDVKSKLGPEMEKREEHERKEKLKCKELFTIMPNRGKKSKFALCDDEVVEKAVDETLQKFVELYHFHVSPKVMGNMKKNILQAMQSDSMESSCTKLNVDEVEDKHEDEKGFKEVQKSTTRSLLGKQLESPEAPNEQIDVPVHKELKKKTFKSLIIGSNERLQKHSKEIDIVENERLKHLNMEFENFLHSIQNHIEVSNLKIQSIILEKEEHGFPSKQGQFVYNFSKKSLESEKAAQPGEESLSSRAFKECGVQAAIKKEPLKKSVRVQVMEYAKTSEQGLQTDDKSFDSQATQTDSGTVPFRELKELKSFDISPGLYRMVKSTEAGKFYLYPEQLESKGQGFEKSTSAVLKDRKYNRKRELLNILSKERTKERRICFREKERGKIKRNRKSVYAVAHLKTVGNKKEKSGGVRNVRGGEALRGENSVNCLYFRNSNGRNSESHSKKDLLSRNPSAEEAKEGVDLEEPKEEEHLGCVWFWNGKKINPGCDLKTHVEDLLREKLKEMTDLSDLRQVKTLLNDLNLSKENSEQVAEARESLKSLKKKPSSPLCLRNLSATQTENQADFTNEVGNPEATSKAEENKMDEKEEKGETEEKEEKDEKEEKEEKEEVNEVSQDKILRNVATQNSQQTILSFNLMKTNTRSKTTVAPAKKKHSKHTKPARKLLHFKRAQEIIRAVEEIKQLQRELESKRADSGQSDSPLGVSSSSSSFKNDMQDSLSLVLGLRNAEQVSSFYSKTRPKKVIVDHEVQTTDPCDPEDAISLDSRTTDTAADNQKHLELIENVLGRVNHKERENLWNDLREFIRTKIGRDINDDGAREVCIEIEQDMSKHGNGAVKQAVMARGHYLRNEGDVEVEIDLTLDDLERILRQRQKRIRRQHMGRKKNKKFISSSSFQSDLTKDEVRKCQKYLNKFANFGGEFLTEEPSSSQKKNKDN